MSADWSHRLAQQEVLDSAGDFDTLLVTLSEDRRNCQPVCTAEKLEDFLAACDTGGRVFDGSLMCGHALVRERCCCFCSFDVQTLSSSLAGQLHRRLQAGLGPGWEVASRNLEDKW